MARSPALGLVKVVAQGTTFASTFSENVGFGSTGRLVLSHSQTYGGTISAFSHTGTTSLDLTDIAFSGGTKATYAGTAASGILTVTDGTHTANIHLTGNYLTATWTLSAAAGGGTHVGRSHGDQATRRAADRRHGQFRGQPCRRHRHQFTGLDDRAAYPSRADAPARLGLDGNAGAAPGRPHGIAHRDGSAGQARLVGRKSAVGMAVVGGHVLRP